MVEKAKEKGVMENTTRFVADVKGFKEKAREFMPQHSLELLRIYGRREGLRAATRLKKTELIEQTIAVICGEQKPDRTARGAPRKNEYIPSDFLEYMNELKNVYLCGEVPAEQPCDFERKDVFEKPFYTITVRAENGKEVASFGTRLDFQIIISNQQPITKMDLQDQVDTETE